MRAFLAFRLAPILVAGWLRLHLWRMEWRFAIQRSAAEAQELGNQPIHLVIGLTVVSHVHDIP